MAPARAIYWGTVLVVGLVLVGGPAVGFGPTSASPTLGDGDATVADVAVLGEPSLDRGRFGTRVTYLRPPDVRVEVRSATGRPRLLVRTEVPAMDTELTTATILPPTARGSYRLSTADRPYPPGSVGTDAVTVRTTVRVQSFAVDRTVLRRNDTVEVGR